MCRWSVATAALWSFAAVPPSPPPSPSSAAAARPTAAFVPSGRFQPPRFFHEIRKPRRRRRRRRRLAASSAAWESARGGGGGSSSSSSSSSSPSFDVKVVDGPFDPFLFASTGCWGRKPLLIRSAFASASAAAAAADDEEKELGVEDEPPWPSWDFVTDLACDEDAESRIITHKPGDPTSFELQLGPFEARDVRPPPPVDPTTGDDESSKTGWTLIVNDVDRFHPPLSDWTTDAFAFVPRWRLDDGQISLATAGGSIGPHVDDYDVFLIQTSGAKRWDVGRRFVTPREESERLVEGIDVRVLTGWDEEEDVVSSSNDLVDSFELRPGDALYLPPRVPHSGTAVSDGCVTLSVGFRAPSASDLVSRLAERTTEAATAAAGGGGAGGGDGRYADPDLLDDLLLAAAASPGATTTDAVELFSPGTIAPEAKARAKRLIRSAINEILDDDDAFDEFFGTLVTEPTRVRCGYPVPLVPPRGEGDDEEEEGRSTEDSGVRGDPAKRAVESMLRGEGSLRRAEGVAFARSTTTTGGRDDGRGTEGAVRRDRLFANGLVWTVATTTEGDDGDDDDDVPSAATAALSSIADRRKLTRETFSVLPAAKSGSSPTTGPAPEEAPLDPRIVDVLEGLVEEGLLYGSDD